MDNNKQITTAGSSFNNSKREETSTESINRNQEPQSTNKRQVSKSTPISASPSANSVVSDERRMKMNKMTDSQMKPVCSSKKKNFNHFNFHSTSICLAPLRCFIIFSGPGRQLSIVVRIQSGESSSQVLSRAGDGADRVGVL